MVVYTYIGMEDASLHLYRAWRMSVYPYIGMGDAGLPLYRHGGCRFTLI